MHKFGVQEQRTTCGRRESYSGLRCWSKLETGKLG